MHLVGSLYILDHIDARQVNHTKWSRTVYFPHSGTLLLHQHLLLHLPMHLATGKFFFLAVFFLRAKAFCIQALKAYRGNRDIAPFILNLGTRWRWVVSFARRPHKPPENGSKTRRIWGGWAPERIRTFQRKEYLLSASAFEPRIMSCRHRTDGLEKVKRIMRKTTRHLLLLGHVKVCCMLEGGFELAVTFRVSFSRAAPPPDWAWRSPVKKDKKRNR